MRPILVCVILLMLTTYVSSQNLQPSQLLSTPFLMCPAQVGNSESPRASLMYKNDWFGSCLAGFDAPVKTLHGGVGLDVIYEDQQYNRTILSARGIYSFCLKINDDFNIRTAAYVETVNTHQDAYASQGTNPSINIPKYNSSYFDEGLSLAFDYRKLSLGATCFHLLRPDIGINSTYRMDRTYSFFVGYDLWMMKGEKHQGIGVSPLLYVANENSDFKATIGFDFVWNNIFAGAYYCAGGVDIYTLIYHAGARVGRFQFGYAFDKTESDLLFASGTGHEVFLNYFFEKK